MLASHQESARGTGGTILGEPAEPLLRLSGEFYERREETRTVAV